MVQFDGKKTLSYYYKTKRYGKNSLVNGYNKVEPCHFTKFYTNNVTKVHEESQFTIMTIFIIAFVQLKTHFNVSRKFYV